MARVNKTRFAILGCLSIRPMSAYDIKIFMARSTTHFWMEHEAQLYPTLKQLHQDDCIDYQEEKAQKAGIRKIYHVTDKGIKLLQAWLMQKTDNEVYRSEFLLKLFFGDSVDDEVTLGRLEIRVQDLNAQLAMYHSIETELKKRDIGKRQKFVLITLRYGIHLTKAEVAWCDEAKKTIKSF